jgi:hypothetical protein
LRELQHNHNKQDIDPVHIPHVLWSGEDTMPAFFDLLTKEADTAVRVVLETLHATGPENPHRAIQKRAMQAATINRG